MVLLELELVVDSGLLLAPRGRMACADPSLPRFLLCFSALNRCCRCFQCCRIAWLRAPRCVSSVTKVKLVFAGCDRPPLPSSSLGGTMLLLAGCHGRVRCVVSLDVFLVKVTVTFTAAS